MAQSKHFALRDAIAALFATVPAIAATIDCNRRFDLASGLNQQVHVNFAGTTAVQEQDQPVSTGRPRDWLTRYELTFLARKVGSDEAADVADAMWVEAFGRLMADRTLGGLAMDVIPADVEEPEIQEGETSGCRLTCFVLVLHRTTNASIST